MTDTLAVNKTQAAELVKTFENLFADYTVTDDAGKVVGRFVHEVVNDVTIPIKSGAKTLTHAELYAEIDRIVAARKADAEIRRGLNGLNALARTGKHVYEGTASRKKVAASRSRSAAARVSRRANRKVS